MFHLSYCDAELDALESDMGLETEDGVPAYLQPDKEPDLDAELNLPSAPTGHAAVPAGRAGTQVNFLFIIQGSLFLRCCVCMEMAIIFHKRITCCFDGKQ